MIILAVLFSVVAFSAAFWLAQPLLSARAKWAAPLLTVAVVFGAAAIYLINGQPGEPGQPFAQAAEMRRDADPATLTSEGRIERLRDQLRQDDQDAEAWAMLGRELARSEREMEAVSAFQRSLQLDPIARTLSDFGQTLINLHEGEVTPDARAAFEQAAILDPRIPEAPFFMGLAAFQDGNRELAADLWVGILGRLEDSNAFRPVIARQAFNLLSQPDVDMQNIAEARTEMVDPETRIASMVQGLEDRLAADPVDISGWLVLARVRRTLGDEDGARAALDDAAVNFRGIAGVDVLLDTGRTMLGISPEEDPS